MPKRTHSPAPKPAARAQPPADPRSRSLIKQGSNNHQFGRSRYNQHKLSLINPPTKYNQGFQKLPQPIGPSPYRLDLKDVIDPATYEAIVSGKYLVFHTAGDTGGVRDPHPQEYVAYAMEADFYTNPADPSLNPAFFYLLGDCVYFNGQASQYYPQFYEPYEHYLAPIFAVPGNHDGDPVAGDTSLSAFVRNYCAPQPGMHSPDAGDSTRTAMNQPNVYWTLVTPFAWLIGLYTNVPEGGEIHPNQLAWLAGELKGAGAEGVAIIVTMHHPIYSADEVHSGSQVMHDALAQAVSKSGVMPDLVLAGHVHDYQRYTRTVGGKESVYIVAGAGGYHNLHRIGEVNGEKIVTPVTLTETGDTVTFEKYVDDQFGFLRIELSNSQLVGKYYTVGKYPAPQSAGVVVDTFTLDWQADRKLQG
ncbi:MAG TPA: metallophosphoesterase [Polyangiaceae bacterium]|nr:metallophosphoesterase [Polyangiaceae bacterium]